MFPFLYCSFSFCFSSFLFVFLQFTFLTEGKLGEKGTPAKSIKFGKIDPKINFFPHRFLDGFLMVFGSIFDHFFDDFSMFFASLFRDHFFIIFLLFPNRFLNRANPKIIEIPSVLIGYNALDTFRKRSIFRRFSIPKSTYFCIIFHDFS